MTVVTVVRSVRGGVAALAICIFAGCYDETVCAECRGDDRVCSGPDAVCELSCEAGQPCTTTCDDDAGCSVDCGGASTCAVTCGHPTWCNVDCRGGACAVACESRCVVTNCLDGPCTVTCGGGAAPMRSGDAMSCPFRA